MAAAYNAQVNKDASRAGVSIARSEVARTSTNEGFGATGCRATSPTCPGLARYWDGNHVWAD